MAGKNTSKTEHDSNLGAILPAYSMPVAVQKSLSEAIGVELNQSRLEKLEHLITIQKDVYRSRPDVKTQDIKRTLMAMSKLDEEAAQQAYKNCDVFTEAHILREIYHIKKEGKQANYNEAISRALITINDMHLEGGNPGREYDHFIKDYLSLWRLWSSLPITSGFNEFNLQPSPTLQWCRLLLNEVICRELDPRKLKRLITKNR